MEKFAKGLILNKTRKYNSEWMVAHHLYINPSETNNFRHFQPERLFRGQFLIWWKCRKFSYRVENTVGKGEIACYEQFLLFPQCFQKICTADT